MRSCVLVLALCAFGALAQDSFDSAGVRILLKVYDECSKADSFSPCLKKKALTVMDRLGRMEKFSLVDGVNILRSPEAPKPETPVTEEQLEKTLPRSVDAQDEVLNDMLMEKASQIIGSRTIEVSLPKMSDFAIEEGRGKGGGGGGGGKGGMKGMMGGMMMGIAAKMAALIPIAIAGLFLLAGKALITAKIALLISGIIALKKIFASKGQGGGGGGHGHGWQSSGGGGGGWQSGGGGWDKRSIEESQNMAYKAYVPK